MLKDPRDWMIIKNKLSSEEAKNICDMCKRIHDLLKIIESVSSKNIMPTIKFLVEVDSLTESLMREILSFCEKNYGDDEKIINRIRNGIKLQRRLIKDSWDDIKGSEIRATKLPLFLKQYYNFLLNIYNVMYNTVTNKEIDEKKIIANEFSDRIGVEFEIKKKSEEVIELV